MKTILLISNWLLHPVQVTVFPVFENNFDPIQDGLFPSCLWMGGKMSPLPKTCHINHTITKVDTVIFYLKKIQKVYESRDTPLEFC